MTEPSIGARIRTLRGKVFTQRQLAESAGVSVDLIRKLEQGIRLTASIGSLQRIARALDVDVSELIGKANRQPSADPRAGIVAIRRALTPVDDLLNEMVVYDDPLTIGEAKRTLDYAWGAYWMGSYDRLTELLPTALGQFRATVHSAASAERLAANDLLARLYWLTGCCLVHLGEPDPAFLAVRQALLSSEAADDPLLDASLRCAVAWQLLVQGRYLEAHGVAVRAAKDLEPSSAPAELPQLSVYGSLLLTAATSAARDQRVQEAQSLVSSAGEVAVRVGTDRRDYEAYFGPSQVVMQQVDVHVVSERFSEAIEQAKRMPPGGGLPLAARARYLSDQALAHARLGNPERALDALLTAERIAPDWIRHQTAPRQVVGELLATDRRTPLRNLARRLGVTG